VSNLTFLAPSFEDDSCVDSVKYGHIFVEHDQLVGSMGDPARVLALTQILLYFLQGFLTVIGLVDRAYIKLMEKALQSYQVKGFVVCDQHFWALTRLFGTVIA